jgi:adenylate kinase
MKQNIYKILILGPQGSGKGTQATLLSKHLHIPAFSMGQLLRDEIETESELGKEIASIINKGNLVCDQIAAEILETRLKKRDVVNGYILDGFPRDHSQYEIFIFDKPTHVFVIDLPREESLQRLGGRLVCKECWNTTNTQTGISLGDKCSCGGEYIQRDDDTPKAILLRLEIYQKETIPIIEAYEKQSLVFHINGVGTKEEIQKRILHFLNLDI